MSVWYEWDVELVSNDEHEDIEDHYFCDSYIKCLAELERGPGEGYFQRAVLVRHVDRADGWRDDSWAYLEGGKLPEFFEDASLKKTVAVPRTYYREVEKAHGRMALTDYKLGLLP